MEPTAGGAQAYHIEGFIDSFYFQMANRANGWQTTDGTVFGNCASCGGPAASGIADPFDVYGLERTQANYNIFHKTELAWLPFANVPRITSSGSYRLYAQDAETAINGGRLYGLRMGGYQGRDYWVEYRQGIGVLVNWGGTLLLDMTPGSGAGFGDAPLLVGQTFTDPLGNSIAVTGRGGTNPEYVDLSVTVAGSTPTPTPTPISTPTPTPTATPTPNPTPTPTPGPAGGPAVGSRVTLDMDGVFVRQGPSINYPVVG